MNIAICDDEKIFLEEIAKNIIRFVNNRNINVNVKAFYSGKQLLDASEKIRIDIVFLDIDIPKMNGFEVARKLRKLYPNCIIIFCSSYNELVYESFEYAPFWFLCKSNYGPKLITVLEKALKKVEEYNKEIVIKTKGKMIKVSFQEIIYAEVVKHKIRLHLEKEILEYRGNLSDIESQFKKMGFLKINSGCMVNMKYIFKIQKNELILNSGELLVISRSNQKNVKDGFYGYLGKE